MKPTSMEWRSVERFDALGPDPHDRGDTMGALPSGHDVYLVRNLIHYFAPEEIERSSRTSAPQLSPGADCSSRTSGLRSPYRAAHGRLDSAATNRSQGRPPWWSTKL